MHTAREAGAAETLPATMAGLRGAGATELRGAGAAELRCAGAVALRAAGESDDPAAAVSASGTWRGCGTFTGSEPATRTVASAPVRLPGSGQLNIIV